MTAGSDSLFGVPARRAASMEVHDGRKKHSSNTQPTQQFTGRANFEAARNGEAPHGARLDIRMAHHRIATYHRAIGRYGNDRLARAGKERLRNIISCTKIVVRKGLHAYPRRCKRRGISTR